MGQDAVNPRERWVEKRGEGGKKDRRLTSVVRCPVIKPCMAITWSLLGWVKQLIWA